MALLALPKVGDEVYVPSAFYISRGRDDVCGGRATVERIEERADWGDQNRWWIYVHEVPDRGYNWALISRDQERLRREYAGKVAHPCPDDHPSSNTGAL